jgi:membrane protein YdbS with pleckstrin-like domain
MMAVFVCLVAWWAHAVVDVVDVVVVVVKMRLSSRFTHWRYGSTCH